jgi:hypothetical protein
MLDQFLEKQVGVEKLVAGQKAYLPEEGREAFQRYFSVAQDGELQSFLNSPEGQEYKETLQKLIPEPVVAYRGVLVEDVDKPLFDWSNNPQSINSFSTKRDIAQDFANRGMVPEGLQRVLIKAELDQSGIVWHYKYIQDEAVDWVERETAISIERQQEVTAQYSSNHKVLNVEVLDNA